MRLVSRPALPTQGTLPTSPEAGASPGMLPPGDGQGGQFTESSRVDGDAAPACRAQLCTRYTCLVEPHRQRTHFTDEDKLRLS